MGSGTWSPNTYQQRIQQIQNKGQDAFAYSQTAANIHPSLNPHGLEVRESRDSAEHPDSNAIIVGLDVSGSMGKVVRGIHSNLPQLFKLVLGRNYIPHPQIMFTAFSNARCDVVPLQVAQFESDNRLDQHLENMIVSGGLVGGCDEQESSELIIYTAAKHTSFDAWEKRKRKGYIFLITDEPAYMSVKHEEVNRIFGSHLRADIPLEQLIKEAREKFHIFNIIPTTTDSGRNPRTTEFWKSQLDPLHVIVLDNPDNASETIAITIGLVEGTISLDEGLEHLRAAGATQQSINEIGSALKTIAGTSVRGTGFGIQGLDDDKDKRTRRL